MTQPNQPNQSELESDIEMLLLRVYNGEYDRSASQTLADVKKRIVSLITANYTPNSEVEQLKSRIAWLEGKIEGLSNDNLTPHLTPHLTPKKLPRFEP